MDLRLFTKAIARINDENDMKKLGIFLLHSHPDIFEAYLKTDINHNPAYIHAFELTKNSLSIHDYTEKNREEAAKEIIEIYTRLAADQKGFKSKLETIKDLRSKYSTGLKEAKDIIDYIDSSWNVLIREI